MNKICKKCGIEKDINEFYINTSKCKKCRIEYQNELSLNKKDYIKEYKKEHRLKNIEKLTEKSKNYYKDNKDYIKQKSKEHYSLNKKDDGFVIWITNKIASIFDNIGTSFPKNLNL